MYLIAWRYMKRFFNRKDGAEKILEIQYWKNPWFSLGIHIDHGDPSLTVHLPFICFWIGFCWRNTKSYRKIIFRFNEEITKVSYHIFNTNRRCGK